jgi:DNA-binding NarL/FixJ family response regulator
MAIKLLVVDDHEIVRRGVVSLLEGSEVTVVADASDGDEAVKLARKHRPDVILLDVRMGEADGIEVVKRLRAAAPQGRVVMLSAFDNTTYVARAVSAGVHDYVLKSATRREIIDSILGAGRGDEPSRSGELRRIAGQMAHRQAATNLDIPLTPRETQVLRLVAMGLSNKEIADSLAISIETVKEHVQNLLRKLALSDRTQAAVWAIRHGIG